MITTGCVTGVKIGINMIMLVINTRAELPMPRYRTMHISLDALYVDDTLSKDDALKAFRKWQENRQRSKRIWFKGGGVFESSPNGLYSMNGTHFNRIS